ncbi:hypothetical protein B0H13DRAFT_2054046 [Mycena leptocephala]|nr:hypothetical protein B0H13DRAFT_2054046 [Mycena leptocephala]
MSRRDIQICLNNLILRSPKFKPQVPILPRQGWSLVNDTTDPETLSSLETLGDSRIGYLVSELQITMFPAASPNVHRNARGYLLSNATFQHLNYAMGVDGEPVETYNKGSGNALEIFFQAFGRTRGLALSVWVGDVFPSLITTVMDCIWTTSPTEQVTINTVLPQAPVTVDKRRKLKSHHQHVKHPQPSSSTRRQYRRAQRLETSEHKTQPIISLPSTAFTFVYPPVVSGSTT